MPSGDPGEAPGGGEDLWPWEADPIGLWRLGYTPKDWDAQPDARVVSTTHRHANFDYATSSVRWASGFSQTLPSSLYLASKPAFFGANPWPWVDPTGATRLHTLPAKARFRCRDAERAASRPLMSSGRSMLTD